ncbi:MAG: RNA methyltransferase [Micrococcales bacterium]|nr:RNA methyltransferase [Micrococcales bacterium]
MEPVPNDLLTNPRADRVRQVHALAGASARDRSGRFLVEGPQGVREAVASTAVHLHAVYLTDASARRYPEIAGRAADRGVLWLGTSAVLGAMSGDAQEVVAVADHVHVAVDRALAGAPRLVAVLVQVRDPGNAGTVVRTADAAGATAVVLCDTCVDVHNPKVVRASAGSLFHLPVATGVPTSSLVATLHDAGLVVVAATADGRHDLDDLLDGTTGGPDLAAPTAWLFGNEAHGLPPEVLAAADATVRVAVHGKAESLNLAAAAAVCLYASARAQR